MAPTKNLYQRVVDTSVEYLGPAAERFIRRQIMTHLSKEPEEITRRDIPELTSWVKLTFALLTENQELVEAYAEDLRSIGHSTNGNNKDNHAI